MGKKSRCRVSESIHFLGSGQITVISVVIFVTVIAVTAFSQHYMASCIDSEADALENRSQLRKLGEQLAYSSDYLTEQAREYSLTGDIEHLYNYWHEVLVDKTRDEAVDKLSSYSPPEEERRLLYNAKEYSDKLIETETLSMKLMLSGKGLTAEDYSYDEELYGYVKRVEEYEIPEDYRTLSSDEMKAKSSEILYDYFYAETKTRILTPIDEFQEEMNVRLDDDVLEAEKGIRTASRIKNICSALSVAFVAILLVLLEMLYIRPLKEYTDVLESNSGEDISKVRIEPKGSAELYKFAQVFDKLSLMLREELIRTEKAEHRMSEAKTQAERANNAKSEFLAHMSHELRTPLAAITGYLYLLEQTRLDKEQREYCRSIGVSSENLLGLINNVLDFSKIESGYMTFERTDYDFALLLDEVVSITKIQAMKKGLRFRCESDENIPHYVKGDSLRLKQVLINLCGNAVKFTDEGEVLLSVVLRKILSDKTVVRFSVRDTGMGVSEDNRRKIFEPFVQSDVGITRKYGGTGLGLPISDMIVRNSSGGDFHIEVFSNEDRGTTFAFCAYLYNSHQLPGQKENGEIIQLENNVEILLVDDDDVNLEIEKRILKSYGVNVTVASNGFEAIELCKVKSFSLIFLDLHMPMLDGFETARRIRDIPDCTDTPIVALTADVVSGVEQKAAQSSMNGYLSKPFKPEKLKEIIAKFIGAENNAVTASDTDGEEVFDYKKCLAMLDDDDELIEDLANRFLKKHLNDGELIAQCIKKQDYSSAGNRLHDLKGVSGNLCCTRLYICCDTLMKALSDGDCGGTDDFLAIFKATVSALEKFLDEKGVGKSKKSEEKNFGDCFDELLRLCESCDITAADYFYGNKELFKDNMEKRDFERLEELIGSYELMKVYDIFGGGVKK